MCISRLTRTLQRTSVSAAALLGLSTLLLPIDNAQAQPTCGNLLAVGPVTQPISGSRVIVGQTITIQRFTVASVAGNCLFRNGDAFMALPDGTVLSTMDNFSLNPAEVKDCFGAVGNADPSCLAFTTTYVVNAADINRDLTIIMPARGQFDGSTEFFGGTPNQVHFFGAGNVDGFDPQSPTTPTGAASGTGRQILIVVNPRLTISKICDQPCFPYGAPITFHGTVCNTGDVALINISLNDTPTAALTFAATTSAGNPFNPATGLLPGECVDYTGSYQPAGNLCGPFTDTIVACGTAQGVFQSPTVCATNSATCHVTTNPRLELTKDCQPRQIVIGVGPQEYTETFTARNTGDVPLQNVVIRDTRKGVTTDYPCAALLNPGESCTVTAGPFPVTAADCPSITDTAVATANNICPPDAECPFPATVSSAAATCTVQIICQPAICITKEVACVPPAPGTCDNTLTYSETATGVEGAAFCYRITVLNCGPEALNNVTVNDPDLAGVAGAFPTSLAVGQSETRFFQKGDWPLGTHANTATASGVGAVSQIRVSTNDTATVVLVPISVVCDLVLFSSFDMDNNPNDNHVLLPDSAPVQVTLKVLNTGQADLNVSLSGLPCSVDLDGNPIPTTVFLAVGASTQFVCSVEVACPAGLSMEVSAEGTAVASVAVPCIYDSSGVAATTTPSKCAASVRCEQPVTCRTTGGGILLPGFVDQSCTEVATTIFPSASNGLEVDHISHGGQLGAPFSQMDCGAILGNPCIRGQWEHVRHYKGRGNPRDVIDMNFHSVTPKGVFDSLSCACLGCCDPTTGAFIPPTLGPLIHKFQICNPDDHKVCGPQPRPSPANAIIFSGIGRITPTDDVAGPRASRSEWVIFRVYIEDRSEPGGLHPRGAVEPADIYCFQAWKTGIKTSRKPDFSTISTAFRTALGQANCDFLNGLESGTFPIGTLPSPTVNGLTADIQDCGPLHSGNRQIHPSTGATCDK